METARKETGPQVNSSNDHLILLEKSSSVPSAGLGALEFGAGGHSGAGDSYEEGEDPGCVFWALTSLPPGPRAPPPSAWTSLLDH